MTTRIGNRLDIYGPQECLACGERKYRDGQLTCRNHPGHPLYLEHGKHEAGTAPGEDTHPARASLVPA